MEGQQLTTEQILEQLKTRGYEEGGFGTPLRHFRGRLDSITGGMIQRGQMPQPRLEVTYNFSDLEVFESVSPYVFPIAQVSMMHSTRIKSGMGVLGASMDKIINASADENLPQNKVLNQDALIGKLQEWKQTPGHMMWDGGKGEEVPRDCWEVQWVEGFEGTPHSGVETPATVASVTATSPSGETPVQRAINLLDGKTQAQWNNLVFQDTMVKGDTQLINSIINGQFLPPLEQAGTVTKDVDGVYHKV